MKKILLSLAAVSALAATAAPAAAQPWRGDGYHREISRGDALEMRIQRAQERGQLNWREARSLRENLRTAQHVEFRYARDGHLTGWERADLDHRYDLIASRLRSERNDRDYGYGYGRDYRR